MRESLDSSCIRACDSAPTAIYCSEPAIIPSTGAVATAPVVRVVAGLIGIRRVHVNGPAHAASGFQAFQLPHQLSEQLLQAAGLFGLQQ